MRFVKSSLLPSYVRQPHYKSLELKTEPFEFACFNCADSLAIKFDSLISEGVNFEQTLGEDFAAEAREFYRIGAVGKSQDGGWPSMLVAHCRQCETRYLIYAGVAEVYNSVYHVTIQGITEIIESEKS